jgi:MoaA/NifB/PqqE/SkfB family radical SAM enzyme
MAKRIVEAGFVYVGISLDGMKDVHDKVRGKKGSFDEAMTGIRRCRDIGMKVGIRFTLHGKNVDDLPRVLDLLEEENIPRFCMYHLAYAGRGDKMRRFDLEPAETRTAVEYLFQRVEDFHNRGIGKEILTVDNHVDAVLLYLRMRREDPERAGEVLQLLGWNGGNQSGIAITSIDPLGDVHADQFSWNYSLGNVRDRPFSEIWPDRSDPRMASCRFLDVCNGNLRARAESYFGDFLAPDPACYLSDEEIGIEAGSPEAEQATEWLVPVQQEAKAAT